MTKTSYTTRFSYAASDVAGQLVFCVISFYLLYFYTDVYGLSAGTAGTILLVARLIDALDTPVWGILFDRTRSRHGKSRPWFLWLCVPYAVFGVLIVNLTAFQMVAWLGGGDDRKGFMLVMPIYATGSVLLYLLAFRNLKEVVRTEAAPTTLLGGFGAMKGNWPWMLIFASSFCFWIAFIARVSTVPYFFEYTLRRKDLVPFANALDFVSLASVFFMPWLCRRWSKATVWAGGLVGLVLGQLIVAYGLRQGNDVSLVMTGWTIGFLASGVAMAMPFSVLSDSVDYGEWKTGIRAAGILTAIGAAFCLKAGAGLGGALPGWILQSTGCTPGVAQSAEALRGIEWAVLWVPAIFFAAAVVPVLFYGRFENMEPLVQAELAERRARTARSQAGLPDG